MPRLPTLRTQVLGDLARQARFGAGAALLRQVRRVESLAEDLDASLTYPEDWLIYRVTGYTPTLDRPRLVRGSEVLKDLSALAEHLSEAAGVREGDAEAQGSDVDDLCARWGVTRRTLERFRRAGLVARRVRTDASRGHTRLVFSALSVSAFERRTGRVPSTRRRPARMTDAEKRDAVAWARRFHARTGCSLNRAASRLSRRTGRATESIRRALVAHDRAADAPIFDADAPLTPRDRRVIWRALRRGIPTSDIAERFGRTRSSILGAANQYRLALLRRFGLGSGQAWTQTADPPAGQFDVGRLDPPRTFAELVRLATSAPAPHAERERSLAIFIRSRMHDADAQVRAMMVTGPTSRSLDRAETALRAATPARLTLLADLWPLVLRSIAERAGAGPGALGPILTPGLVRVAVAAVAEAMDRFDPARGGRLAAPVSVALSHALPAAMVGVLPSRGTAPRRGARRTGDSGSQRSMTGSKPAGGRYPGPMSSRGAAGVIDGELVELVCPWERWLAPPAWLRTGALRLDSPRREALLARYGLGDESPMTLEQVRVRWGVSSTGWVRAYQDARRMTRSVRTPETEPDEPSPGAA